VPIVSILQISDLHRDPVNPIRNAPLLESLENDRQRYMAGELAVRPPDLIFVTGDIIQGVKPGTADASAALRAQYAEATDFLARLTDSFGGGDRGRVVIIPGNHDVSACHTMDSARKLDLAAGRKRELVEQLFTPNSPLRWSWPDFELYEIADADMYARRMEAFAEFYGSFYGGTRSYDLDASRQYDVFDFPKHNLVVAAFSSCFNNDILNRQGAINPNCVATAGKALREPALAERLRLAVWHHNTEGLPMQSDYMDSDMLQHLIDGGFSLGFHGHQHRPQFLDTRFKYGGDRRITVISAGTLCGSASFRFGRAYNIVELDTDKRTGRLHLREMQNDTLDFPIWGSRALPPGSGQFLEFGYDAPPPPLVRADDATVVLLKAQRQFDAKDYKSAADTLRPLAGTDGIARRILVESLKTLGDRPGLIALIDPPQGETEAIYLMDALWQEGRRDRLRSLLGEAAIANSVDPSVVELRDKYRARLKT
jgi:hypothetical protein